MTIHVATVHWQDDRWIDVQLAYLERHLPKPFKVYAFLNHLEKDHSDRFFYSSDEDIKEHSTKLNLLGDLISFNAADSDPLLFIDGDAFPIADLDRLIEQELPRHELIAIKREEASDVQPHPSFCLTTVGFWRRLGGDWRKGRHHWVNAVGREVSDVGARVLKAVDEQGVAWAPLLRSNKENPHPLFFGVYDDLVYHHGAGFRAARGGRMVIAESGAYDAESTLRYRVINRLPRNKFSRKIRRRFDPVRKINQELKQHNANLSAEWWDKIQADPEFYRELI